MANRTRIRRRWTGIARLVSAIAGAATLTICPVSPAWAHSVGAYPTQLLFSDALRGGSYQQTIGIIDDSPTPDTYHLSVTGDIATWASFREPGDPATVITAARAHAGPPTQILLQLTVPARAANGTYEGIVHLTPDVQSPGKSSQSGQGVGISAVIPVDVQVTGTQHIAGTLLDAFTYPAIEVGSPLRIFTVMLNSGNVEVRPSIDVTVSRNGATMFHHVFAGDPVDPGIASKTIESDWTDTSAIPVGQYVAHVDVKYFSTEIGSRAVAFRVVPYGSLRRAGTLDGLVVQNRPDPGRAAIVQAVVHNTGQIETRPVFHGRLYLNGKLLSGIMSVPVLTLPGRTSTISMVINVPSRGTYMLTGQANFDGTDSNSRSLTFKVGTTPGRPMLDWLLGGIGLVSAGGGVAWRLRGRRRGRPGGGPPAVPTGRPPAQPSVPVVNSHSGAGRSRP